MDGGGGGSDRDRIMSQSATKEYNQRRAGGDTQVRATLSGPVDRRYGRRWIISMHFELGSTGMESVVSRAESSLLQYPISETAGDWKLLHHCGWLHLDRHSSSTSTSISARSYTGRAGHLMKPPTERDDSEADQTADVAFPSLEDMHALYGSKGSGDVRRQ